jgi:predicted enzyme related to lactoylglutathione lyase
MSSFLSALFGWTFFAHGRRYREATPERGPRVGLLEAPERPEGETQQAFIAVEDLDDTLARAQVLGGAVAEWPVTIPDYGRYARIRAPDGTTLGLFEPGRAVSSS